MFALEHVGVKHNHYESRSAVVCSLAQTPRHLSEELKAAWDALSVFQASVPTPRVWGWHKSQRCQAAQGGALSPGVAVLVEPAQRSAQSTAEVLRSLCQLLCRTLELSLYHQLENQVFSFLLPSRGSSAWLHHYCPLTTSPFNFIPSYRCARCCFRPGTLNLALCTVKLSAFW